ncbi:unnamed protein product, partial [Rotaria sp. Silwood1]
SKLPSNVLTPCDDDFLNFVRQEAGEDVADLLEAQNDDTYVVKPGVRGNVDYLIDLFQRKYIEDAKLTKSSKHVQSSSAALSLNRTTEEQSTTTTTIFNVLLNNSSDNLTIPRLYLS